MGDSLDEKRLLQMTAIADALDVRVPDGSTLLGVHMLVCENLWTQLALGGFYKPDGGAPITDERNNRAFVVLGRQGLTNADIRGTDGSSGSMSIVYLAWCALPDLRPILNNWVES